MYCWGSAEHGTLGLGSTEGSCVTKPIKNQYIHERVKFIACGWSHSLLLLENGAVYSCGNNCYGQLGCENTTVLKPDSFDGAVSSIYCGANHSIAISHEGTLFGWGDNSEGQLGLNNETFANCKVPHSISLTALKAVVHVACGSHHTMVLTQDGRVFSWGKNAHGQLGHSANKHCVTLPTAVCHLDSIPILKLTAEANQSFALTATGMVFSWGKNDCGQLGLGHTRQQTYPSLIDSLVSSYAVTHIACGDDHTVFLFKSGCLYTCGSNQYGQLGRGQRGLVYPLPGILMGLMTTIVTQIACGRYHTVLLAKYTGQVISFGRGHKGQLGIGSLQDAVEFPVSVHTYWSPPSSLNEHDSKVIKGVYAGGNCSFATIVSPKEEGHPVDFCSLNISTGPCFLSHAMVNQILDIAAVTNDYSNILNTLEMFFSSPSCVNGSFLNMKQKDSDSYCYLNHCEVLETFKLLHSRLSVYGLHECISKSFINGLLPSLPEPPPSIESLRLFFVIISYLQIVNYPKGLKILVTFIKVFLYLGENVKAIIANWLFNGPKEILLSWIDTFKVPIAKIIASGKQKIEEGHYTRTLENTNLIHLTDDQTWALQEGIKVLKWLYECNKKRFEPVSYQKFYIDEVTDCCDLREDYISYKAERVDRVLFMRYSFVLNVAGKAELIYAEGRWHMMEAIATAHRQNIYSMFTSQALSDYSPMACVLQVRRNHLLQDTISGLLSHDTKDLLKPLKVQFEGEEGVDDGGIQKEFFMLLIKEILNPDFGMFYEEEESNLIWFREQLHELDKSDKQYYSLIGMICGLAIYNGVIVDLPFPVVLYKKLLGGSGINSPSIADLQLLKPSVGKQLKSLLDHDVKSNFKEVFGTLKFEITRQFYDTIQTVLLKPNGSDITVTMDNKEEYVKLYVHYELVLCIQEQYDAFALGFNRVCNTQSEVFKTLHPEELLSLVTGSSHYDFSELKNYTQYINGYSADHPVIISFWSVVNDFPIEAKKKLLVFWTGSNRVPVAGMRSMKLRIQQMDAGPDNCNLPVAHTCFNILDLPSYPTQQLMKEKILQAIYNTEGFGII